VDDRFPLTYLELASLQETQFVNSEDLTAETRRGPSVLPEEPHQLTTIELRSYGLSGVLVVGAVVESFRLSFGGADSDGFDSPSVEVVLPSSGVG
jgi:hypothetical protein